MGARHHHHHAGIPNRADWQARVNVRDNGGWGGTFGEYLTRLVETTGLAVNGNGLLAGPLKQAYWAWAGRYAGVGEDGDG
jgi:hypothetical protein